MEFLGGSLPTSPAFYLNKLFQLKTMKQQSSEFSGRESGSWPTRCVWSVGGGLVLMCYGNSGRLVEASLFTALIERCTSESMTALHNNISNEVNLVVSR